EPRMLEERGRDELHHDRGDADPGRGTGAIHARAQVDERLDVELEHRRELRGLAEARDHPARDRPAPAGERDRPPHGQLARPRRGLRAGTPGDPGGDVAVEDAAARTRSGDLPRRLETET